MSAQKRIMQPTFSVSQLWTVLIYNRNIIKTLLFTITQLFQCKKALRNVLTKTDLYRKSNENNCFWDVEETLHLKNRHKRRKEEKRGSEN